MADVAQSAFTTRFYQPGSAEFPILLEHYEIHGIIGEGGMGRVFKAYHLNLKRFVAIKTLRIDHQSGTDLVGRFKQEMELVGQMDHPNVVRASDAGEKNGIFYLVMEYLSGCDLSHLCAKQGRLEPAFACELISQAALGLHYIHEKTLIHRDIKPSNLMLTRSGQVKILDLGLARFDLDNAVRQEKTPAGHAVGTYSYMAPEQATAGRRIDGRADIYSLGCTLFKLLTGRTPFSGPEYDNVAKVLTAHCQVPLESIEGFALVPENVRGVLVKMTAKDPAQRYQSGRDVAEALRPIVGETTASMIQPHELAPAKQELVDTPVRPLTDPLPEELSRLTGSVHETPRNTPAGQTTTGEFLPKPARNKLPWLVGGAILSGVLLPLIVVLAFVPFRDAGEPRKNPPPDDNKPEVKQPDMIVLPVATATVRNFDLLKSGEHHDLLRLREFPPVLIGYRKDDVLSSAHWYPSIEKLTLNPSNTLLAQLGATSKEKPSFTLQTRMFQQLWHQNVGLFWGYQENAQVKNKREPLTKFAVCQVLQLKLKIRDADKAKIFGIQRSKVHLGYTKTLEIAILLEENIAYHEMPALNLGNEKIFSIEIKNGALREADFAGQQLTKLYRGGKNDKFGPNGKFSPSDYQGSFGIFSASAAVTVRAASAMLHDN